MILFTALIGPYVIDWTAYRDRFEAGASAYIGRPVAINGKANLRLLPIPVLSFTDVRVGNADDPDVVIERFRAEVELMPLLQGEIRILQMMVDRPEFHLDFAGAEKGAADPLSSDWAIDAADISLGRLEIIDGTAHVEDSGAKRSWRIEAIDAVVEAGSLRGPGKLRAKLRLNGEDFTVQAAVGRMRADRSLPARLSIVSPDYPIGVTADGSFAYRRGEPPQFVGLATLSGLPPDDGDPRSAWAEFRAQGEFDLTPQALTIEKAQLSYGATDRPLILAGAGHLDFAGAPRFEASIKARQIDIDRTFGSGAERPSSVRDGVAAFLQTLPDLPRLPLPGVLHLDAQGVVVGGGVMQAVGLDVATAPEGWRIEDFAALLPGETRVDLSGLVDVSGDLSFAGHGRIASKHPSAFAAWWRGQAGSAGAIESFTVEADLDLSWEGQSLSDLVATTGAGTIEGLVELRRFRQSGEIFATVDLSADRADLRETRALVELLAGDALTRGRVDRLSLSLRADALSAGGIEGRSVVLEGGLDQGVWQLRRLAVADLAGSRIDAHGSLRDAFGERAGQLEASIAAQDVTGAAEFLAGLLPQNTAVAHFRRIAPALSPVHADISVEAGSEGSPFSFELTGSLAETHIAVAAAVSGSPARPESLSGTVRVDLDSGNTAGLLTQLGLDPVPIESGPARIEAGFEGALSGGGKLNILGTVAGVDFSYNAETALLDGEIAAAGDLRAKASDIDTALLLAGVAVPGLGEGHAATATGRLEVTPDRLLLAISDAVFEEQKVAGTIEAELKDGIDLTGALAVQSVSLPVLAALGLGSAPDFGTQGWNDDAVAAVLPPGVSVRIDLTAEALGLGLPLTADAAKLKFALSRSALGIELAQADFAGGTLKGAITAAIADGEADVAIRGSLQGGELQALLWERDGLPAASGQLDLSVEAAGRGRSAAGVVASLSGSGSFAIGQGRINGLNPGALTAAVEAGDTGQEPDEEKVREAFAIQFGSGAFPFGRAAGSFSINSGAVRVGTVSVTASGTDVLADAAIDLNTFTLSSDWLIRSGEAGPDEQKPAVEIRFAGPIRKPERQTDVQPIIDLVHNRHLQKQLQELEALEQARRLFEAAQAEERRDETERRRLDAPAARARPAPPRRNGRGPEAAPLDLLPNGAASQEEAAADLVQQIGPAVQDMLEIRP